MVFSFFYRRVRGNSEGLLGGRKNSTKSKTESFECRRRRRTMEDGEQREEGGEPPTRCLGFGELAKGGKASIERLKEWRDPPYNNDKRKVQQPHQDRPNAKSRAPIAPRGSAVVSNDYAMTGRSRNGVVVRRRPRGRGRPP